MNPSISCLFIDDNKDERAKWQRFLQVCFQKEFDARVDCIEPSQVEKFLSKETYNLFIVDAILEPVTSAYEISLESAKHLISSLRERYKSSGIIVVSNFSKIAALRDEFIETGADLVIGKFGVMNPRSESDRKKYSPPAFACICQDVIDKNIEGDVLLHLQEDLTLSLLVHRVGESVLKVVGKELFGSSEEIHISLIWPGFSGAVVFGFHESDRAFLVKLSRNSGRLRSELHKAPAVGDPDSNYYTLYDKEKGTRPLEGGWHRIIADYQTDSILWLDWFKKNGTTRSKIESLLGKHFLGNLAGVPTITPDIKRVNFIDGYLHQGIQAQIEEALNTHLQLCEHLTTSGHEFATFDQELVREFFTAGTLRRERCPGVSETIHTMLVHGDFHLRNAMVRNDDDTRLIDAEHRGPAHWATDIARFIIDLFMSLFSSSNSIDHFLWDEFSQWRRVMRNMIFQPDALGEDKATKDVDAGVLFAVRWCWDNLERIYSKIPNDILVDELRIRLIIELLRSSYRSELPTPKRVLGLVAASDALSFLKSKE